MARQDPPPSTRTPRSDATARPDAGPRPDGTAEALLRVALDVGPLHGHRTGVGVATEHLLAALARRTDVQPLPYLVSFRARPAPGERRLPLPAGAAMRCWSRSRHPRVDRWLRDADVVHGTNYVAPSSRRPTVISMYDCWFLANPREATPAVARAGAVLRRLVADGAWLHVSSEATARAAADLLDTERIRVVHLGPPAPTRPSAAAGPETMLPDALRGRPFIVAIGTLERRKDIPALVEAFGLLAPAHPDLGLAIAGAPGDDHTRVVEHIGGLPSAVQDRIHVLGAVGAGLRDELLARAAVLAYPSVDEGFGFPILEAQQVGTAVVARPVGSIPEVGGAGIALAVDTSVDALASAIRGVLGDDERRLRLVEAGRANLSRFSWDATAAQLVDLYRTAIAAQH